jgi:DNA-directed RNA polymerase subunit omega
MIACAKIKSQPKLANTNMPKRYILESSEILQRVEELIEGSSSRYRMTVQVAVRAKMKRYEDDDYDDRAMKPVVRAIVEMSDEMKHSEILSDTMI